ncbi:MAG: CarD family transcriptional regulator [Oscillospiraceae bacterium]|nr:CarD family transcriptional regulator [Oscillospiraceae bacterium]
MFKLNERVFYANTGACTVINIETPDFVKGSRLYYVLSPIFGANGRIYVPVDASNLQIRKLISKDDAEQLISTLDRMEAAWIDDDKLRESELKEVMRSADRTQLVCFMKGLYKKRLEKQLVRKQLRARDEELFHRAEKLLYSELAAALDMTPESMEAYIISKLKPAIA